MRLRTLTIARFMTVTPRTISPEESLARAHALMRYHRVRHLPVVSHGDLVGLVSLGDLHLIETLPDINRNEVPVEDAMSDDVYVVGPDASLDRVAAEMLRRRIGSVVVAEAGRVIGIFTTADALRAFLDERAAGEIPSP